MVFGEFVSLISFGLEQYPCPFLFFLIFTFWTSLVQLPCKVIHILGPSECFLRILFGFKMLGKYLLVTPWTTSRIRSITYFPVIGVLGRMN